MALFFSVLMVHITILNNILLLTTQSYLSAAQDSSFLKCLDMHTFVYATPTFVSEAFCLVTQLQLLLTIVTMN